MRSPEQGTMVDCVYCKYIEPELKGTKNCPVCHGKTPEFRPTRMMDKYTSQMDVLDRIDYYFSKPDKDKNRGDLLNLLTSIDTYQFDIKEALINKIKTEYNIY